VSGAGEMAKSRCCPRNASTNVSLCDVGNQGDRWSVEDQCLEGYVGPLCMICGVDYVRVGQSCSYCPGGSDVSGGIFSLIGVCSLLMLFTFLRVRRKSKAKLKKRDENSERSHFVGEIVILISYMQILSGLTKTYGGAVEYREYRQRCCFECVCCFFCCCCVFSDPAVSLSFISPLFASLLFSHTHSRGVRVFHSLHGRVQFRFSLSHAVRSLQPFVAVPG
jgi:hypothetical protein